MNFGTAGIIDLSDPTKAQKILKTLVSTHITPAQAAQDARELSQMMARYSRLGMSHPGLSSGLNFLNQLVERYKNPLGGLPQGQSRAIEPGLNKRVMQSTYLGSRSEPYGFIDLYADPSKKPVAGLSYSPSAYGAGGPSVREPSLHIGLLGSDLSAPPILQSRGVASIIGNLFENAINMNRGVDPGSYTAHTGSMMHSIYENIARKYPQYYDQLKNMFSNALGISVADVTGTIGQPRLRRPGMQTQPRTTQAQQPQPTPSPTPTLTSTGAPFKLFNEFYRPGQSYPIAHRQQMVEGTLQRNPGAYIVTGVGSHMTGLERMIPENVWNAMTDQERTAYANLYYGEGGTGYDEHMQHMQNLSNALIQRYGGGGGQQP